MPEYKGPLQVEMTANERQVPTPTSESNESKLCQTKAHKEHGPFMLISHKEHILGKKEKKYYIQNEDCNHSTNPSLNQQLCPSDKTRTGFNPTPA